MPLPAGGKARSKAVLADPSSRIKLAHKIKLLAVTTTINGESLISTKGQIDTHETSYSSFDTEWSQVLHWFTQPDWKKPLSCSPRLLSTSVRAFRPFSFFRFWCEYNRGCRMIPHCQAKYLGSWIMTHHIKIELCTRYLSHIWGLLSIKMLAYWWSKQETEYRDRCGWNTQIMVAKYV